MCAEHSRNPSEGLAVARACLLMEPPSTAATRISQSQHAPTPALTAPLLQVHVEGGGITAVANQVMAAEAASMGDPRWDAKVAIIWSATRRHRPTPTAVHTPHCETVTERTCHSI